MYGNIRQSRLRVVLGAVEEHLRAKSTLYEAVTLPIALEIEHVMPRVGAIIGTRCPRYRPRRRLLETSM